MSKKTKRQVRRSPTEASVISEASVSVQTAPRPQAGDFNPDYTNIKKDLKRIGILAASFFAFLIILSFFLH